jgi:hypothetical protein
MEVDRLVTIAAIGSRGDSPLPPPDIQRLVAFYSRTVCDPAPDGLLGVVAVVVAS